MSLNANKRVLFNHRLTVSFLSISIEATRQVAGSKNSPGSGARRAPVGSSAGRRLILKWVSCADKSPRLQVNFRHVSATLMDWDLQTRPHRLPQQATAVQQAETGRQELGLGCPAGKCSQARSRYSCLSGVCLSAAWHRPHPATPICWDPSLITVDDRRHLSTRVTHSRNKTEGAICANMPLPV